MLVRLRRGSKLLTLSGDGATIAGCTYIPGSPNIDEQQVRSILRSGGDITALARRNVTESVSLILTGSASAILAQVREIETIFPIEEPERRASADRIYIEFRIQDTGDIYRSEILVGRVEWPSGTPIGPRLSAGAVEIVVLWTRRYFWEDTVLRTVPLSNANGSNVTTGLTVWNHDDGGTGHDNFANIAAANVEGVIPAPAYIDLKNNTETSYGLRNIYIGHNVQSTPSSFPAMIEGESSVAGTSVSDSNSSNGSFRRASWVGAQNHNSFFFQWTLSSSLLNQAKGNYFRLLARFANGPIGTIFVKTSIRYPADTPITSLQETSEVLLSGSLQDLGVLRLPPIPSLSNPVSLALVLTVRTATSGTLDVDFIQLTALDSWRHLQQLGYILSANVSVIDNGLEGITYAETSGANQTPIYASYGQPIHLWPGVAQRLLFLWDELGGMNIARTFSAIVRYRPRRLTI